MKTKRRRLFFDIETSPNIGLFWEAGYKKNIDYSNIIKERAIICICYKWEDESEVNYLTWDSKQNDKAMLKKFIQVANMADELVGHNGDNFDLKWIRTRCLFHKIDMFPNYVTIDTLKIARQKFRFNSNRLNYIAQYLGLGEKIKTEFDLWKDILLHKDKVALQKMVKYCQKDVKLLEDVWKELRNHVMGKTHYGIIFGTSKGECAECGSDDFVSHGYRVTSSGTKYKRVQCKTCGKHQKMLEK